MEAKKYTKDLLKWLKDEGWLKNADVENLSNLYLQKNNILSTQPIIHNPEEISKRLFVALQILKGFASDSEFVASVDQIVETAYIWAEELIRQE